MEKKTIPYELLVRWDADGALSGAHYQYRTVYLDDGIIVADKLMDPVPVTTNGTDGFPLSDILHETHLEPMCAVNAAAEKLAQALARVAHLEAEVESLQR